MKETLIGVGTACFPEGMSLQESVEAVRDMGADGVEINLGRKPHLEKIDVKRLLDVLEYFEFVTVHGPARNKMDSEKYRQLLGNVGDITEKIGGENVVLHPDWVDGNPEFLSELEKPALENMSRTKDFDRADFRDFMAENDADVVLDVCHCFTWHHNELVEMYMEYADRLSHIHLSGLGDKEHQPLYMNPEILNEEVLAVLEGNKIVIESVVETVEEMEEELTFVEEKIKNPGTDGEN